MCNEDANGTNQQMEVWQSLDLKWVTQCLLVMVSAASIIYTVHCCFWATKQIDNQSKSLRNIHKVKPVTWADWLEKDRKKHQ